LVKKRREKPRREITKRQLSMWQRQERRRRIIFSVGIFIIAAVLVVVGVGWYIGQYKPLHEVVIRVNDTEFNMNYYIKALKYYGRGMPAGQLLYLTGQVEEAIEQGELIKQEAAKLGISVSNDEIDEKLDSYDPPLSKTYRDLAEAEVIVAKLRDDYFDKQVPASAEQRHIMAMFLESEAQVHEVRSRLESGEDFETLAQELSLERFSRTEGGDFEWHPEGILAILLGASVPEEHAFSSEVGVLSPPVYDETQTKGVGYWLIRVLERNEDLKEADIQVVLLGSEEEAEKIRARLQSGEDFAAMAEEFSQHDASKEEGGELDWLTPGIATAAVDGFIFNPDVKLNELSEPIRDDAVTTTGGYWLVEVLDKEDDRKIENGDRSLLISQAMNEWLALLWEDTEDNIESFLDSVKNEWAIEKATRGLEQ